METEDITGLMHLTSLNSLTLSADWIADVAPLSSLCNLTELCLNSHREKNTGLKAVLQGCSKLQVLQFDGVCESEVSELKSQSLKAISMSHCYIDNLPDPSLMPGLITVDVMCVDVYFDDEGALAALHKLATSPFISFNVADLQLSGVDMTCLAEYLPSHAPVSIGLRCLRLFDMELKANDVSNLSTHFPGITHFEVEISSFVHSSVLEAVEGFTELRTVSLHFKNDVPVPACAQVAIIAACTAARQRERGNCMRFFVPKQIANRVKQSWSAVSCGCQGKHCLVSIEEQ